MSGLSEQLEDANVYKYNKISEREIEILLTESYRYTILDIGEPTPETKYPKRKLDINKKETK